MAQNSLKPTMIHFFRFAIREVISNHVTPIKNITCITYRGCIVTCESYLAYHNRNIGQENRKTIRIDRVSNCYRGSDHIESHIFAPSLACDIVGR